MPGPLGPDPDLVEHDENAYPPDSDEDEPRAPYINPLYGHRLDAHEVQLLDEASAGQ